MATPKTSLSAYLLKQSGVAAAEQLFARGAQLTNGLEGLFVDLPTSRSEPAWFRAVRDHLPETATFNVQGQSTAGMIFVRRGTNHFIVTFGHAWQYLDLAWLEPEFGRRVALEAILPDSIIELNFEQVFARFHHAKERAPRATSIREFGVEVERDLVAVVEGVPFDSAFGKVLRGGTSLRISIPLKTLCVVLDKAAALFGSNTYRSKYPSIDNLVPVNDSTLRAALDGLLDRDIRSGTAKTRAVLVAPSFRRGDANSADAFALGRRIANQATLPYLQYGSWEHHLGTQPPTLALAKSTKVHMIDEAGDVFETRSVYECLGYEASIGGKAYVLSSGTWYSADAQFTAMIDGILAGIAACRSVLPAWNRTDYEEVYNELCCKGTGLLHFDKKIISYGGGHSRFEFCDFMDPKRRILYFAKITGKSSDSSHLAEQVKRTVELLFGSDNRFRRKLETAMKKHHPGAPRTWLRKRPRPGDWQLCLVSLGRRIDQLPLFAKCSIARLCRSLDQAGHSLLFAAV